MINQLYEGRSAQQVVGNLVKILNKPINAADNDTKVIQPSHLKA